MGNLSMLFVCFFSSPQTFLCTFQAGARLRCFFLHPNEAGGWGERGCSQGPINSWSSDRGVYTVSTNGRDLRQMREGSTPEA